MTLAEQLAAHPRWEWQLAMVALDYGVVSCLGLRTVIGGRDTVPPVKVVDCPMRKGDA